MKKIFYFLNLFLVILLIISALVSGAVSTTAVTIGDNIFLMFAGGSQVTFQLRNFLAYFFTYMIFVYLIQMQLQKKLNNTGYYQLIRYKSTNRWLLRWIKEVTTSNILYLLLLFVSSIGVAFFFTRNLDFSFTLNETLTFYHITYHFFINGFLQLSVYVLFVFILSWWSKEVFHSLIGIIIVLLFMFPNMNPSLYIPSGLNSMFYILEGYSMYRITAILIGWNIISIWVITYLLKKDLKL
ncbi:hypothetical protein [Planococcus halocryophilus]|uniref:hypothetical protein n=1 Tax=Planococcus halocryophilus TaxID=1215089 RepID=UPI001F1094A8|nr:hypothetical protein [Planococcus halocryophilus]MCH4828147.1 hypothetical protein [Planococcus halocryophilus]